MNRPTLVLLVLAALACSTAPDAPQLIVHLNAAEFQADSLGRVTLLPELVNVGSAAAFTSYCADEPGGVAVNWSVDRLSGAAWVGRQNAGYACAPPTFGSLQVEPAARFVDTLRVHLEPGTYRLRVFYRSADSPEAIESYRASDPSPQFAIRP
jgi:hypothetical protein